MSAEYLAKYGRAVIDNGYLIVPIVKGSKAPGLSKPSKNWSVMRADHAKLDEWIGKGFGGNGVGILSLRTPGVDIDCQDQTLVEQLRAFVVERLGETIERVGLPPKTLLVYRAETAFPKVNSNVYIDTMGRTAKLEVLGDGQQFVALHVHPDTHKPYRWLGKHGVHDTPVDELPEITREDAEAIRDEFERLARERGWQEKKTLSRLGGTIDRDNPFIHDQPKVLDLSDAEIRAKLLLVPNADEYETWLQIGMALFHQYDGGQFGLDLWHEWSATAGNYDARVLDLKWGSFDIEGKKRPPMTARLILKLAAAEEERVATEALADTKVKIAEAETLADLMSVAKEIKHIAFDKPVRHMLTVLVQKQYKVVTGTTATIAVAREMVRYEDPNRNADMPIWLKDTVYIEFEDAFYNWRRRQTWPLNVFNNINSRWMLSRAEVLEGKSQPETRPSDLALNVLTIPTVAQRMYMPTLYEDELSDPVFEIDGIRYINSYSPAGVPDMPEIISPSGERVIERIERHLAHLFRSPRDRVLLMDWIAYIVQTSQRVNWAPIIQGVSGDGKTWFGEMLKAVLGMNNVFVLKGRALEEQYNGWAEGHQVVFIEEVRLHGKNRFDAVNNLKTNITNSTVEIRKMRTDTYNVINQTSYFIATNFRDAMPLDPTDTRYFPMFSRWQRKEEIEEFKVQNPDYYNDLYAALNEPGVIRKWLMERTLSDEFNASQRAPVSASRREMIDLSRTEEHDAFDASLAVETSFDYCDLLLDSSLCASKMTGHGSSAPIGGALNRLLTGAGFSALGRLWVDGKDRRLWTRHPHRFTSEEGVVDKDAVKDYYAKHSGELDLTGL